MTVAWCAICRSIPDASPPMSDPAFHRLRCSVDDGHRHVSTGQRIRHLHADVPAPDHHGSPRPQPSRPTSSDPIVEVCRRRGVARVRAGGLASRSPDQMVESLVVASPGVRSLTVTFLPGTIAPRRWACEVMPLAVVLRRSGYQTTLPVRDVARHPVRDATGRIGAM